MLELWENNKKIRLVLRLDIIQILFPKNSFEITVDLEIRLGFNLSNTWKHEDVL